MVMKNVLKNSRCVREILKLINIVREQIKKIKWFGKWEAKFPSNQVTLRNLENCEISDYRISLIFWNKNQFRGFF